MNILPYVLPLLSSFITPDWTVREDVKYGSYERNLADVYTLNDGQFHPTIIFIHGGGWAGGDKNYYKDRAKKYALAGFNVVSITYTLATSNPETQWPAAERDVRLALQWVRSTASIYGFDVTKLVVAGDSAGGHLALFMGFEPGVQVIQNMYGPSDLTESKMTKVMEPLDVVGKQTYEQNPKLYTDMSPIFKITRDYPPTFIAHSVDDTVIPYSQSQELYNLLKMIGIDTEFLTYNGYKDTYGGHNLYGIPFYVRLWIEMKGLWFTLRHL